jgi:hypothetical protein
VDYADYDDEDDQYYDETEPHPAGEDPRKSLEDRMVERQEGFEGEPMALPMRGGSKGSEIACCQTNTAATWTR